MRAWRDTEEALEGGVVKYEHLPKTNLLTIIMITFFDSLFAAFQNSCLKLP